MASSVNFAQNSYAGEVLEDLLTYTAQGNDTYKEGLIHIKSGIQFEYTIPAVKLGKIIQDNKPTPTSTEGAGAGTVDGLNQYTFTERKLTPAEFMVYPSSIPATSRSITSSLNRTVISCSVNSIPRFRQRCFVCSWIARTNGSASLSELGEGWLCTG